MTNILIYVNVLMAWNNDRDDLDCIENEFPIFLDFPSMQERLKYDMYSRHPQFFEYEIRIMSYDSPYYHDDVKTTNIFMSYKKMFKP